MESQSPHTTKQRKPLGFLKHVVKRKEGFFQFIALGCTLFLGLRALSGKYEINALTYDIASLKEENQTISSRMDHIKQSLLDQASQDPTGAFRARLRLLFGDDTN